MRAVSRLGLVGGTAILLTMLLGLAGPLLAVPPAEAAPGATSTETAQGLTRVRLGIINSASDAGLLIAMDQGYFREQGIDIETSQFDSAARMVAPLGAGQLDAGGGSHSAGLNNAIARGIPIKLVADKGSVPPGFGFQALMFRRDLAESGRLRSPGDMRGMRVALTARGTTIDNAMARWLRPYGMTLDDVERIELNFADHSSALAGRTVDASLTIEPFITRILDQGIATIYQRTDELYPNHLIAEIMYSGQFAREQPEAGRRFLVAYLRGVRDYNDGFVRGDPAKREMAVASMVRHTAVKDPALYDRMVMPGIHPDGRMSLEALAEDQEMWLAQGVQQARIDISTLVDYSFADAAVQALGPYR